MLLIALPALVRELSRAGDGHEALAALGKVLETSSGLLAGLVDAVFGNVS